MPFKSKKQAAKFGELFSQGKISKETLDAFHAATPNYDALPEQAPVKQHKRAKGIQIVKTVKVLK